MMYCKIKIIYSGISYFELQFQQIQFFVFGNREIKKIMEKNLKKLDYKLFKLCDFFFKVLVLWV